MSFLQRSNLPIRAIYTKAPWLSPRWQTCQPLVKENLETHEKKSGDSTKNSEILFFPDQTPFPSRELDTNLNPRAYFQLKMADRRGEKRKFIEAYSPEVMTSQKYFLKLWDMMSYSYKDPKGCPYLRN